MKRLILLALVAVLAGCTATELDEGILDGRAWDVEGIVDAPVPDDPYLAALYRGYLELARSERMEFDWFDAAEFRSRALRATNGQHFGPIDPVERSIPKATRPAVEAAFAELSGFLASEGAMLRAGRQIGEAQVNFDCWLQEVEEAHQNDEIDACRDAFAGLMILIRDLAKLPDNMVVILPEDEGGEPGGVELTQGGEKIDLDRPFAAAGTGERFGDVPVAEGEIREAFAAALAARPKPPREFVITFAFDSVAIRDENYEQVILAAGEARSRPAPEVIVTGYADAPGTDEANLAMSRQRADVVARAISNELRDDEKITLIRGGRGARDLVVSTPRAEEANRRVVVIVR